MLDQGTRKTIIAFGIVGALILSLLMIQIMIAVWFVMAPEQAMKKLGEVLDAYVDEQVDAGILELRSDTQEALLKDRKILLYNSVNARTAKDVSTRLIYLDAEDNEKPIDLYISTQGGWADNAFTIIDTMKMIAAPVNTWAIGGCYSSGALILTAGTGRRYATDNAIVMLHANLDDSTNSFSYSRLSRARYEKVWRETAKLPADWFPMTRNKKYYLTGAEAKKYGLVDEVISTWKRE